MCSNFIFICLLSTVCAYDRGAHHQQMPVEQFLLGDYVFSFYSKMANWEEAYSICQVIGGRLAVVHNQERALFLADALSQTHIGFEDVWIGAKFEQDAWIWVATGSELPSSITSGYPPWLNYPTARGKNCLSIDRKNHRYPIFVELSCTLHRPFICETNEKNMLYKEPSEGAIVRLNNSDFYIYHARATWDEAVSFCKEIDGRLAIVSDTNTAIKLINTMKRVRPAFESIWIGARKYTADWVWVATNQILTNKTDPLSEYPPWRDNDDKIKDFAPQCILLDHHPCLEHHSVGNLRKHLCEEPVFLKEQCNLKRDFVCEVAVGDESKELHNDLIWIFTNRTIFLFCSEEVSWKQARDTCKKMNMTMAIPSDMDELISITTRMADLQNEWYHAWLGGYWFNESWIWESTNETIPLQANNSVYPPWCLSIPIHEENENCLNLDRDEHNVPLIYGFNCSAKQSFICQRQLISIEIPDKTGKEIFVSDDDLLSYEDAKYACQGNQLVLPILNSFKMLQSIAFLLPRDVLFWIGGERHNGVWRWINTNEIIPDMSDKTNYPPWESVSTGRGKMCLAIRSGFRDKPFFIEKPCSTKLHYLCEEVIKKLEEAELTLTFENKTYKFFTVELPWLDAERFCESRNLSLTVVNSNALANFLTKSSDHASLWTSGEGISEYLWLWASNGEKILTTNNMGYPSWEPPFIAENEDINKCLLLNHTKQKPVFVKELCKEKHKFVCTNENYTDHEIKVIINDTQINLQNIITDIKNAKMECQKKGMRVFDFEKTNSESIKQFMLKANIKSMWLDVIKNKKGKWIYADTNKEFQSDIKFINLNDTDPLKVCLTVTTESEKLVLQAMKCDDFSRIICQEKYSGGGEKRAKEQIHVVDDSFTTHITSTPRSFDEGIEHCTNQGKDMIKDRLEVAIKILNETLDNFDSAWLGAKFVQNQWIWSDGQTNDEKGLSVSPSPPGETNVEYCLIFNKKTQKLEAIDCTEKHSVICQFVINKCKVLPGNHLIGYLPSECSEVKSASGQVCKAYCKRKDHSLFGPERVICDDGFWQSNYNITCAGDRGQGVLIKKILKSMPKEEIQNTLVIFVIDSGTETKIFQRQLQLSQALSNLFLLGNTQRASIFLYNSEATSYTKNEDRNCYLLQNFQYLYRKPPSPVKGEPKYLVAFQTVAKYLKQNGFKATNEFFIFFFAMRRDSSAVSSSEVIENLKKQNAIIFIIALENDIHRNQLEVLAENKKQGVLLFTFKTVLGMMQAAKYINKGSKIKPSWDCPHIV